MSENIKRIGVVGCGAIGSEIARAIDNGEIKASISGLCDIDKSGADKLSGSLKSHPAIMSMDELAGNSDIIAEAAGVGAVEPLVNICVAKGIDLLVMSVGGLKPELFERFEGSKSSLYIPSGAVAGIDGLLALAGAGEIETLTLTTTKPPAGLKGASYLEEKGIDLDGLKEPIVVFEGSPVEAIKHFPKNINVSTTISLATAAGDKMKVCLVADPNTKTNTHEINMVSAFGALNMKVENKPSPTNPKTSALAYLSAISLLKKITSNVKIGT